MTFHQVAWLLPLDDKFKVSTICGRSSHCKIFGVVGTPSLVKMSGALISSVL